MIYRLLLEYFVWISRHNTTSFAKKLFWKKIYLTKKTLLMRNHLQKINRQQCVIVVIIVIVIVIVIITIIVIIIIIIILSLIIHIPSPFSVHGCRRAVCVCVCWVTMQ